MDCMLGIYCRTSRKESICGVETIDQQKQAGIKFALAHQLNYTIYEDSGKSGYIEKSKEDPFSERKEFKRLLADIKSGKINQVWVWEVSRLARRNKYYADIIDTLAEKKIILNVLNSTFDLTNEGMLAMIQMQGVWANLERNEIIRRTSRGRAAATDRGNLRHGSMYGYRTDKDKITTPNRDELETVKAIFTDYLNGLNLREIALKYFTDGHPETEKLLSKVKKVKQILAHEEYTSQNLKVAGRQIEKDFEEEKLSELSELLKDDYWVNNNYYTEKIITREIWIKAKEKLEWTRRRISATKNKQSRETNRSLLSGIMKCSTCGNNFYYKDLGKRHGGLVYQHLRTVNKCSQIPGQIKQEKLDTIIDVFYPFFYILFDNTEDRLRQMKISVKKNTENLMKQIETLEKKRNQINRQIENVSLKLADGYFNDDTDAFFITMKNLADFKRQVEQISAELKLINIEIEENRTKESELNRNEKYKISTIDRIRKWFELREQNSFAELRQMLREVLFDGVISIKENYLEVISGDPGRIFCFNLDNDYTICYPFLEQIIGKKINKNYSQLETLWIEQNKEKIERFGERVNHFIEHRLERDTEELFRNNDFLFLPDCFLNISYDFCGINLFTKNEENLLNETYHTTAQVSEILSKPKSSLRDWAYKNGVKSYISKSGIKTLLWTDKDIENYTNRPKPKGNKGYKFTPEQLEHLSKVRKGRKQSEETKRKRSESMKKIWAELTPEERERRKSGLDPYNKKR